MLTTKFLGQLFPFILPYSALEFIRNYQPLNDTINLVWNTKDEHNIVIKLYTSVRPIVIDVIYMFITLATALVLLLMK